MRKWTMPVAVLVVGVFVTAAAGGPALKPPKSKQGACLGLAATIVGTQGADVINGTAGNDVIDARGGNDEVWGHGGDDVICGGPGNDTLQGGDGDDKLAGQQGRDQRRLPQHHENDRRRMHFGRHSPGSRDVDHFVQSG